MMKKCSCGKASETEPEMPKRFRVFFLRNDKKPEDATTVAEVMDLYRMQKHVKLQ